MPTKKGLLKKSEINELVEDFLTGRIGRLNPPMWLIDLVLKNIEYVSGKSFGYALNDIYNPYYETTQKLQKNIVKFSVNKVVHNMNDMELAAQKVDKDRIKDVLFNINKKYNFQWLETEYNTAGKMADSARSWSEKIQEKNLFPFLEYDAIIDDNSREEHAELNGVIKPINDSFWDTYYPPNGYNCRCSVNQLDGDDARKKGGVTDLRNRPITVINQNMNNVFKHNPGKSGEIFRGTHPYMDRRKRVLMSDQKDLVKSIISQYE